MTSLLPSTKTFTILAAGGTDTINLATDSFNQFVLNGTATLLSNYTLTTSGTLYTDTTIEISYQAVISLSGSTVTILGRSLSQEEANSNLRIIGVYNGSSFEVVVLKDNVSSNYPITAPYAVPDIGGTKTLVPGIDPTILILSGTPTLTSPFTVTGTGANNGDEFYVFYNTQVVAPVGVNTVTIFGIKLNDTITVGGSAYIHAVYNGSTWKARVVRTIETLIGIDEINTDALTETIVVDCSFDAARQCNNRIWIDTNFKVVKMYWTVIKALSGTDSGTITPGINGAPMVITPGSFTIPASSPLNTDGSCTPLSANTCTTGTTGNYIDLLAAKTTVDGIVRVSVIVRKIK